MTTDPIKTALEYRFPDGEAARHLGITPKYWAEIVAGYKPFHPRLRTIARYLLAFGPLPTDTSLVGLGDVVARPFASGKPRKRPHARRKRREVMDMG